MRWWCHNIVAQCDGTTRYGHVAMYIPIAAYKNDCTSVVAW